MLRLLPVAYIHKLNPSYMKPVNTLLFLLFSLSTLFSQDQYSLLQADAVWVQEVFSDDGWNPDTTGIWEFRIGKDTLVNGMSFRTVLLNGQSYGALAEMDKRVLYATTQGLDTILDFNLLVGDTFALQDYAPGDGELTHFMVLESIDSVSFSDGSLRKRLNFQGQGAGTFLLENFEASWIDGMGSTRGLIIAEHCGILPPEGSLSPICFGRLTCYQRNGLVLYTGRNDPLYSCTAEGVVSDTEEALPSSALQLFPNPASETVTLAVPTDLDLTGWQYQMVDAFGRVVLAPQQLKDHQELIAVAHLPAGMYRVVLQSGRQVVTRSVVVALD